MNLYRIGKTVVNLDRVNGIVDHEVPADPDSPDGPNVLRLLFDHGHIDLTGKEAQSFRHWFRHAARSLDPHKDEDGEELVSPDEQVRRVCTILCEQIDRERPRDRALRHTAHRLEHIIDQYLTGELQPVRLKNFERDFGGE